MSTTFSKKVSVDGRNITVEALNERRLNAVKFRLSGLSVVETAFRAGLSQPTVIDAFKAYQSGGWNAVPVGPRGRGLKKMGPKAQVATTNIKHFIDDVVARGNVLREAQ